MIDLTEPIKAFDLAGRQHAGQRVNAFKLFHMKFFGSQRCSFYITWGWAIEALIVPSIVLETPRLLGGYALGEGRCHFEALRLTQGKLRREILYQGQDPSLTFRVPHSQL